MSDRSVRCSGCGTHYTAPHALGLWSCPVCKVGNDETAALPASIRISAGVESRGTPLAMRLGGARGRLSGRKSLYGYADRVYAVTCPTCTSVVTMTNNVRSAQCDSCETVVQRS